MKNYLISSSKKIKLSSIPTKDPDFIKWDKEKTKLKTLELTAKIEELQEKLYAESKHKILVVLQGMDTAGKDGTIRHVFEGVNPSGVKVAPFKKPSDLELSHDYLWRVHQKAPKRGEIVIFNRSHYEDVLVVKVHDLVPKKVWSKRYDHIKNFEQMLVDEGTTILKFFLHISKDEQRERIQERLDRPEKNWKFTMSDIKERKLWDEYQSAYEDVLEKTSTKNSPWHIIPADRKWQRNYFIASLMLETLENLKLEFPKALEAGSFPKTVV